MAQFTRRCARAGRSLTLLALFVLIVPVTSEASNTALLRLLQILRDRGSISAEEYEELRLAARDEHPPTPAAVVADEGEDEGASRAGRPAAPVVAASVAFAAAPEPVPSSVALGRPPDQQPAPQGDARVGALEQRLSRDEEELHHVEDEVKAHGASLQRLKELTDGTAPALVTKALAGKWYERISLRGYTQFRETDVLDYTGVAPEVPADRSVNANESFMIRRGRFVFSGDLSDHLFLYAQSDFNASTGAADFSLQMRDLYADISLDKNKEFRLRLGQSKVPFGWVNMQSSQNRAPMERPDALNSAVEGERDLGAYLMWASKEARQRFRDLVSLGLKGSGDYGVVAIGAYSGQGLNRPDQNGDLHLLARYSYPFKLRSGQFFELGVQAHAGKFVSPTQAISVNGAPVTPLGPGDGVRDDRVGVTAVWYPQPIGVEMEWNVGRGPALSADARTIDDAYLHGGYVQANYRRRDSVALWFPFVRWNYFDGARKFARNAPRVKVNEVDFGLEVARWLEVELTAMYTHTFERTRTGSYPYSFTRGANRVGFQVQWNY